MANLPLAFAEILIGGILATAGITGDTFSNIIKGDITKIPLAGASTAATITAGGSAGSATTTTTGPTAASSASGAGSSKAFGKLTGAGGITPTNFATALLAAIGAPLSKANISSIVDWEAREGGNWNNTAKYNPLNTTQAEPGYSQTGTQGNIGSYTSWAQGLQATVTTLENGDYNDILAALRSGAGLGTGSYEGLYTWSGHSYSSVP